MLLIDRTGDVLWETARAGEMHMDEAGPDPAGLIEMLRRHGAAKGSLLDPAVAEVVASEYLRRDNPTALYQAIPVAVDMDHSLLAAVTVATRNGPRRVAAKQWIDATEEGTLARLACRGAVPRDPESTSMSLYFQKLRWGAEGSREINVVAVGKVGLEPCPVGQPAAAGLPVACR